MRRTLIAWSALLLLCMASYVYAQDPAPVDPAAAPADPAAAPADPADTAPPVESLADRLKKVGAAVPKTSAERIGPRLHDGTSSMRIPVSGNAEDGSPLQIIDGTIRVEVDGHSLLPTDFALARMPATPEYVLRFLKDVPAGAAVEVSYRVGAGNPAGPVLSSGFMGAPGQALPIASGDGAASQLPVKLYWGQETGQSGGIAASGWQALSAMEGMKQYGRREYGLGVSGFRFRNVELTYGAVSNESGSTDNSYRDDFISSHMLGTTVQASALKSDPMLLAPEGRSRDVRWSGMKYGDPTKDKMWYVNSRLRMDQNYTPVAESGAAADMAAFLSDSSRWGGRNLVSPWWSGYYAGVWKTVEGGGNQGRTGVAQFAGWDLAYSGYGFREGDIFSYSNSEFAQERLDTHLRYAEVEQKAELHVPSGGPDVAWTRNTLTTTSPPSGVSTDASSGQTVASSLGENSTTTHETLSLTQRLKQGQNSPVVSVTQHQWNQLNRLSGIEAPTMRDRTTSISGVSLFGLANLDYQNTRNESEDISYDPSETHRLNFGNLRLIGPIALNGSFGVVHTERGGVRYTDNTLTAPGFRVFEGMNVSGLKYQRLRDAQGAESTQRTVGFAGQFLGADWSANVDWLNMMDGFTNQAGAAANPYGQTFDQRATSFSVSRTVPRLGTELRAGFTDTRLNGESLGQLYRAGASQVIKPGLGLGNFIVQGVQYRHVDRYGTMRPSYSYGVRYEDGDKLQAGMRAFEHYGAGDEMQFVSRTTWLKTQLGPASLSVTWRSNPLLNEAVGRAQPFLWRGDSKEYALSGQVTPRMTVSASVTQNALPAGYAVESSDWSDVAFTGPMSSALRPTAWSWDENWGTTYSVSYNFGPANLTVGRSRTRFNRTASLLTAWTADLSWQIAQNQTLALGLRDWRGASPIYGQSLSASDVGHPLGLALSLRYARDWGNGKRLSLVFADAGPLNNYWGQNNAWGQEASSFVGALPYSDYPHTKVYLEFQTPF